MRFAFSLFLIAGLLSWYPNQATGQTDFAPNLYAALYWSIGMVTHEPQPPSGLYAYGSDTTWNHIGWDDPRVRGIAYHPDRPGLIYLACGNGVLRSKDYGKSWKLTTDWHVTEGLDITVDMHAPDHVYVATGFGIWKSDDAGETWKERNDGIRETYSNAVLADRTTHDRIIAGAWDGLYLSIDGADTWRPVGPKDVQITGLTQSASRPSRWLAATMENGVLVSEDNGKTWQRAPSPADTLSLMSVAIDPLNADRLAAAGWHSGVYVSTDAGAHWVRRQYGLPTSNFYQVLFDPNHSGRLWAATVERGLFYSDDMGNTWKNAGLYGTLISDMTFIRWE